MPMIPLIMGRVWSVKIVISNMENRKTFAIAAMNSNLMCLKRSNNAFI